MGQKMNQDFLRSGEFKLYRSPENYVPGIGARLLTYTFMPDFMDELADQLPTLTQRIGLKP